MVHFLRQRWQIHQPAREFPENSRCNHIVLGTPCVSDRLFPFVAPCPAVAVFRLMLFRGLDSNIAIDTVGKRLAQLSAVESPKALSIAGLFGVVELEEYSEMSTKA